MGYTIQSTVFRNGQVISATAWSIVFDADTAVVNWQIELDRFYDIKKSDVFDICRSYGPLGNSASSSGSGSGGGLPMSGGSGGGGGGSGAGDDIPWISALDQLPAPHPYPGTDNNTKGIPGMLGGSGAHVLNKAHPDSWNQSASRQNVDMVVTGISGGMLGVGGATGTLGIDTYFIAQNYLNELAPYGWEVKTDGAVYYKNALLQGSNQRIFGDGLPAKDQPPGSFQCVVLSSPGHYTIASYLARALGCAFYSNCPFISLKRVFRVPADKGAVAAIVELYRLWQPTVHYRSKKGGAVVLEVLDAAQSNPSTDQPQQYSLGPSSFEVMNFSKSNQVANPIIDHVVIKGAKSKSLNSLPNYGAGLTPIVLPEVPLPETRTVSWTDNWDKSVAAKGFGDYSKGWGKKGVTKSRPVPNKVTRTEYYYEDPNDRTNWVLLREVNETVSTKDGVIHVIERKHKYAAGFQPIRTIEEEKMLTGWPGRPDKQVRLVSRKITDQSHILDGLKRSLAQELQEGLVVVNEVKPTDGSPSYYTGATTIVQAQQQNKISTAPNTTQKVIEMTIKQRQVTVSRVTAGMLSQFTLDFDGLTGTTKTASQIVKDPMKSNVEREETQFYAEFSRGSGKNKAVVVEHPDIADLTTANMVAERVFARSSVQKGELTLKLLAPLAIAAAAFTVKIADTEVSARTVTTTGLPVSNADVPSNGAPSMGYSISSAGSEGNSKIQGGVYSGVSVSESLRMTSTGPDHSIELKLRSAL